MTAPNQYKIQITNPCANDWADMKANSVGRFCDSCSKSVIDFSSKTDAEIKAYLLERKGENICGRFQKQQVDRIRIEVDQNLLQSGIPFWQKFLVIFLVCFGQDFLGVDFCFAQESDSTTVKTEQVDTTLVEATEQDTTFSNDSIVTGFIPLEINNPLLHMETTTGPVSITYIMPQFDCPPLLGSVVLEADLGPLSIEEEISLLDTLKEDTLKVASNNLVPSIGFANRTQKPHAPKRTPERPQNVLFIEEQKRRRRKKKSGEQKAD